MSWTADRHSPESPTGIIVTGASKGIGLSIVRHLLSGQGFFSQYLPSVLAISRTESDGLKRLKAEYPDRLIIVLGDVSQDDVNARAVKTAIETWGSIDGIILNAGTLDPLVTIVNASISDWQSCFAINLFSNVSMLSHATEYLRSCAHPHVVFVSSGAAVGGTAGWGAYNTSKAALNSLCRTYANEEKHIASFAVRPGVVDTEMQIRLREIGQKTMDPKELERFTTAHKEGKLLKPEE